jgi:hypothetical protein
VLLFGVRLLGVVRTEGCHPGTFLIMDAMMGGDAHSTEKANRLLHEPLDKTKVVSRVFRFFRAAGDVVMAYVFKKLQADLASLKACSTASHHQITHVLARDTVMRPSTPRRGRSSSKRWT